MKTKFFLQVLISAIMVLTLTMVALIPGQAQELAKEQVVRLGASDPDVDTLDPYFALRFSEVPIINIIYEGLLAWPRGKFDLNELKPSLAERWELAPDKMTWTFYLRKGVKWHEGYGEFTAEDVKFSIERLKNPKLGSSMVVGWEPIESVTVVNPYTVKIRTKFTVPDLPTIMINYRGGYIMCKKAVEKLGDGIKLHPIGTGPFAFKIHKPRESITLVAHEDYWRGKPIIKKVEILFILDHSTREMAFRSGELDAISLESKKETIDRLRKDKFDVDLTSPADMSVLYFNLTRKPLNDIRIRRALCYATNRDEFINFLGKEVAFPVYSSVPPWYVGYTDKVEHYEYSLEKAKKLLAEAGYPNGFKLDPVTVSSRSTLLPPIQILQEMWKKIGVTMELKVVDHPSYLGLLQKDVNPIVLYNSNRYPYTANTPFINFYHSKSIVGKPTAIANYSHYGEAMPGIDKLVDEAYSEGDINKKLALWAKAQQQIAEDAISFTLYVRRYSMAKWPYLDLGFKELSQELYDICETTRILKH